MHHAEHPCAGHSHRRKATILAGLAALLWFLLRVVPKPSRAAYPCQRAAAPLASGFVVWLVGLFSARLIYRQAAAAARGSRYALAVAAVAVAATAIWLPLGFTGDAVAQEPFFPPEPSN